jgi:Fic family protein
MIDDILNQIKTKLEELDSLRPIKPEFMKTISSKFKLDSNFHTNHFEGNTLTIGETNSLILHGLNASIAKLGRDIEEMRGHIKVYNELGFLTDRILTGDKLPLELTQNLIKNLHKVIFVEDEIKHTNIDGISSVTTIPAGNYKVHSNSVITSSGSVFEYADPVQVPSLMSDLLDWYNKARLEIHPVVLASIFHYKFIRIHPFGDGNGRMARLLMNWILQSAGYCLVIVKSDKDNRDMYLNSLSLTDNNFVDINSVMQITDPESFLPFIEEISRLELESLDIMIRGAKGEDITDVGDLIKEMAFEAKQKRKNRFSIFEIAKDHELRERFEKDIVKIQNSLRDYTKSVLSESFYRFSLEQTTKEVHSKINSSRKYRISLGGNRSAELSKQDSNPAFFDVEVRFLDDNYTIESVSFLYNEPDFDSKLKQVIQNLHNRIKKHYETNS